MSVKREQTANALAVIVGLLSLATLLMGLATQDAIALALLTYIWSQD